MSPLIVALAVTLAAFIASSWWFGVLRRRKAETAAGIRALAGMKWRECAGLVLQALGEKGYVEAPSSRQPGDGGTEFLLSKGDERVLLGYKHGTAYRLGEANVRDFANAVQLQGAGSGILVTLGTAEGFARDLARRYGVELIDGRSLWPQVEPFAPSTLVEDIRYQAASEIRRGQRMGVFASIGLGLLVFVVGAMFDRDDAAPVAPQAAAPAPAADPAPAAAATAPVVQDPASRDASAAMKELEAIARLSDEERAQRRLTAAARVADLEQANSAIWSTLSTLNISLVNEDGIDTGLVNEACAILIEYEELRYTRLQLEPPASSKVPVRWRQCQ
ncbi:restriction endonuclease [Arenimonas sp. MALMAid1274]|uniref:restriction endonuclease n=1 Tax=Arenimonas sp. MALMAid1274 TaxID=3411630 RepID=UPI003BA33118